MSSVDAINFAEYSGYKSLAAAIVFAAIYFPLNLWFTLKALIHWTYVRFVLVLFCASTWDPSALIFDFSTELSIHWLVRVAAFVIRAVMIKVESAAESRGLFITDQILFGIGYAGLLYSSYTLVLDLYVFFSHIFYNQNAYRCLEQNKQAAGLRGKRITSFIS